MTHTIETWTKHIEANIQAVYAERKYVNAPSLSVKTGRKYSKIALSTGGIYCFVENDSGDIYKASSWKAPAKHVRGNINDPNGSWNKGVYLYGATYL